MSNSSTTSGLQTSPNKVDFYFRDYRLYVTPEYWLVTYRDRDFVRIMRNTEHKPGFALLLLEITYSALCGVRTELRDKYAMNKDGYEQDAKILALECRAADRQVAEFDYQLFHPNVKRKD